MGTSSGVRHKPARSLEAITHTYVRIYVCIDNVLTIIPQCTDRRTSGEVRVFMKSRINRDTYQSKHLSIEVRINQGAYQPIKQRRNEQRDETNGDNMRASASCLELSRGPNVPTLLSPSNGKRLRMAAPTARIRRYSSEW